MSSVSATRRSQTILTLQMADTSSAHRRINVLQAQLLTPNSSSQASAEAVAANGHITLAGKKVGCGGCKNPQATLCCVSCRKYFCAACDTKAHKSQKHYRVKVAEMNSYVDLSNPVAPKEESDIRRSWQATAGVTNAEMYKGKNTSYEAFQDTAKKNPQKPYLGTRSILADGKAGPYVFQTYAQVKARVDNLASGFAGLGLAPGDAVAMYAPNRADWIIVEQASFCHNLITVPLYDTLGAEAAQYVLTHAGCKIVVCTLDKVGSLVTLAAAGKVPDLKAIIAMPLQPNDKLAKGAVAYDKLSTIKSPVPVLSMADVEAKGKAAPVAHRPPKHTDISTFCYTSGTTGDPKGAMLTHGNLMCDAHAVLMQPGLSFKDDEVHMSFLPLAHIYERLNCMLITFVGGSMGFSRGDVLLLLDDIAALQPTGFAGVPRLFNRINDKIKGGATEAGGIKKWLFDKGLETKLANLRENGDLTHWFWDRLVFGKVRAALGGRVKRMSTGSAPISKEVLEFLRAAFSAEVSEGYGLTETTAASTITVIADINAGGKVGAPIACNEIKLVDVPEMNYKHSDVINGVPHPRGEICIRGSNVFKGYYKMPDKTQEALDEQGFLHTGDVGMWLPSGDLKIIDRKKNIFKLAQGEYVAPEKIENVYQRAQYVAQIFVHGESLQNELVAIVIPDVETVGSWAKKNNIAGGLKEWCQNPVVKKLILADMAASAKEGQLRGFEMVKSVHFDHELFSVENGMLTPTMKLKRNEGKAKYAKQITEMYAALNAEAAKQKSKL